MPLFVYINDLYRQLVEGLVKPSTNPPPNYPCVRLDFKTVVEGLKTNPPPDYSSTVLYFDEVVEGWRVFEKVSANSNLQQHKKTP